MKNAIFVLGALTLFGAVPFAYAAESFPELDGCAQYAGSWTYKGSAPTTAPGNNLGLMRGGNGYQYRFDYADGVAGKWSSWIPVTVTKAGSDVQIETPASTWTLSGASGGKQLVGTSVRKKDSANTVMNFRCA